jgi:hypothetical protein
MPNGGILRFIFFTNLKNECVSVAIV